jgi:[ribosomal protein S5]-alanine N-acetyltransferase
MVECLPERIAGSRLLLRPPVLDDAGALFQRIARDRQVTEYLLWTPHPDVAATRRVITERLNVDDHARTWVIAMRHSDEIIGMISGRLSGRHSVEIGYCMGRRWWGKGFMSEALDILMAALDADRDVYRVWATCHTDNERSVRLLLRAGFQLEGRLTRYAVYPNLGPEPRDSLLYAKSLR